MLVIRSTPTLDHYEPVQTLDSSRRRERPPDAAN